MLSPGSSRHVATGSAASAIPTVHLTLTRLRFAAALCLLVAGVAHAEIVVTDDAGQAVRLARPASRIVSLAPHVTELVYAAGAGDKLVGAVDFSDYPEAAKKLPRVGSYASVDAEAVLALKPDLVIGWQSGNNPVQLARLRSLGIALFVTEPRRIEDIAASLRRLGELVGTSAAASAAAKALQARHAALAARYAKRPPVRTFYQIWAQPVMTVNGRHIISDVMRLCGAENVFADVATLAPKVTAEAVLVANPEAIVVSGMAETRAEWLAPWLRWPSVTAVARGNLFHVHPDLINRHTPRILEGAQQLCEQLETARERRPGRP